MYDDLRMLEVRTGGHNEFSIDDLVPQPWGVREAV
jgi:hypothetical protein